MQLNSIRGKNKIQNNVKLGGDSSSQRKQPRSHAANCQNLWECLAEFHRFPLLLNITSTTATSSRTTPRQQPRAAKLDNQPRMLMKSSTLVARELRRLLFCTHLAPLTCVARSPILGPRSDTARAASRLFALLWLFSCLGLSRGPPRLAPLSSASQ